MQSHMTSGATRPRPYRTVRGQLVQRSSIIGKLTRACKQHLRFIFQQSYVRLTSSRVQRPQKLETVRYIFALSCSLSLFLVTRLVESYVPYHESLSAKRWQRAGIELLGHDHEVGVGGQLPHALAVDQVEVPESVERDGRRGGNNLDVHGGDTWVAVGDEVVVGYLQSQPETKFSERMKRLRDNPWRRFRPLNDATKKRYFSRRMVGCGQRTSSLSLAGLPFSEDVGGKAKGNTGRKRRRLS
jgi:hypothetical protein